MSGWLGRTMRAQLAMLALVGVLLAVTCVLIVGGRAWLNTSATGVFHRMLDEAPPAATALTLRFTGQVDPHVDSRRFGRHIVDRLDPVLDDMVGAPRVAAWSPPLHTELLPRGDYIQRTLTVAALPHEDELVHWASGRQPRPGVHVERLPPGIAAAFGTARTQVMEIGLSRPSARALRMPVGTYASGSVYLNTGILLLRVAGVYTPSGTGTSRLDDVGLLRTPIVRAQGTVVITGALTATTGTVLGAPWGGEQPTAQWTVAGGGHVSADRVDDLQQALARLRAGGAAALASSDQVHVDVVTGLDGLADEYRAKRAASDALVTVPAVAVVACAVLAMALAAGVLAGRRRNATRLLRARGAGLGQLVRLCGGEAVALAVPGIAVALLAVAVLRRAPPTQGDVVTAVVTGACCVAVVTAIGLVPEASTWREVARRQAARTAVETLVVVLAVVGAVVLYTRGELQGRDPFLATVPIAVAVAATVLATRQLPALLWRLRGVATRARYLSPLTATSGAVRAARTSVVATGIVVLAAATGVLALAVTASVPRGVDRAAWERVGADVSVQWPSLEPASARRVAALPAVSAVAPVVRDMGIDIQGAGTVDSVTLVAANPAKLAAVDEGAPVSPPVGALSGTGKVTAHDRAIPAVVSPDIAAASKGKVTLDYHQTAVHLHVVEQAAAVPGITSRAPYVLIDVDAFRHAVGRDVPPDVLLVKGAPSHRALMRALGPNALLAQVSYLAAERAKLAAQPMAARTSTAFWVCTGVAGGLAVGAVLLAAAVGAAGRRRTASVLRTLGATRRQTSLLSAIELVPTVVLAPIVGGLVGLLLVWLADPGLDLRPLAGGPSVLHLAPDAYELGLAAACGALVAVVAILGTTAAAARRPVRPVSDLDAVEAS